MFALACVADSVSMSAKQQHQDPCSGRPTDSTNYRKCVSNFLSCWLENHGTYSNPGTHVGDQEKDFGALSQTDLTRSLVSSVVQASLRPSTKSRFKLEIYEILQKKFPTCSDEIEWKWKHEASRWNLLRERQVHGPLLFQVNFDLTQVDSQFPLSRSPNYS